MVEKSNRRSFSQHLSSSSSFDDTKNPSSSNDRISLSNHDNDDDMTMRKILLETKTIAMVGASNKESRPSFEVMRALLDAGYHVIPINPQLAGQQIHGQTVVSSLDDFKMKIDDGSSSTTCLTTATGGTGPTPVMIDMVDIFRRSQDVPEIVEQAIQINAKSIWMQIGVINEEAAHRAVDAGLDVVMNACPKIELRRLDIQGPSSSSSSSTAITAADK